MAPRATLMCPGVGLVQGRKLLDLTVPVLALFASWSSEKLSSCSVTLSKHSALFARKSSIIPREHQYQEMSTSTGVRLKVLTKFDSYTDHSTSPSLILPSVSLSNSERAHVRLQKLIRIRPEIVVKLLIPIRLEFNQLLTRAPLRPVWQRDANIRIQIVNEIIIVPSDRLGGVVRQYAIENLQ